MEYSATSCPKDGLLDLEIQSNFVLPKEMLENIFKYLNNVHDLAEVRRVCRFWCLVATPLYLTKIDEVEIDFRADRKETRNHRALSAKYREKQRQNPNRKLSETEIEEINRNISMTISVGEDSENDMCKYCDYIESGGTVEYTNFKFVGINLNKNDAVRRFFCLCGKYVKILTISVDEDYWYCDHPAGLCKECLDQQKTKCVLNMSSLKTLVESYSPNITTLTLDSPKKQRDGDTTKSNDQCDDSEADNGHYEDDALKYLLAFGDVSRSDDIYKLEKKFPAFNNIHTIRIVDELVAALFQNMFLYQLFTLCPNVTSLSNFGTGTNAFDTLTYDFVRGLVTNVNTDILTELFIRNLDPTIICTLLRRHKERLQLKFLKVNYLVTHLAELNFLDFLESQSATLETMMCGLKCSGMQWSNIKIRFPNQMPKLSTFRIGLGKHEQSDLYEILPTKVAAIDWAKQFPALKTLMLPEFATNVTIDSFFKYSMPLATVTGLELPAKLSSKLMTKAGLLFPNVTQLAVGFQTMDSLRQIWTMWPKLKSLHLSVIYYDERNPMKAKIEFLKLDELLTGFDEFQMEMAKVGNRYVIGEPKFPSIKKLKDLRELTIFDAPYRTHSSKKCVLAEMHWINAKENAVSDISVHHALMKLPSLKYLDISHYLHNISPSTDIEFCDYSNLFHEDNVTTRDNFTIMCNHRGREEAYSMCRLDAMYKDK